MGASQERPDREGGHVDAAMGPAAVAPIGIFAGAAVQTCGPVGARLGAGIGARVGVRSARHASS